MDWLADFCARWWLTWLFGIIAGWLALKIKGLKKKQAAQETRQAAIEEGVQALLRAEIIRAYDKYHEQGRITLHGKEAVNKAYDAYHALGGNGTVTDIVEAMRDMEVET